jgi:glycosyltransferase involved in cell wall biosynthesis
MPVLNGELFIEESIRSCLKQDHLNEIIVVDNGSQDSTAILVKKLSQVDVRVKLVKCELRGIANALNYGISVASGNFIARLDADDLMVVNRLSAQVDFMNSHSDCVMVGSQISLFSESENLGISNYPTSAKSISRFLSVRNPIAHPSVLIRKSAVEQSGGYNPMAEGAEDLDLWLRLSKKGNIYNLSSPFTRYRIHDNQVTKNVNLANLEMRVRQNYLKSNPSHLFDSPVFYILVALRIFDLRFLSRVPFRRLARERLSWHRRGEIEES